MKKNILVASIFSVSITACAFVEQSGEMVEEVGGAIEKTGEKHNDTLLGKGAQIGGSVYKFVGGAIKKIAGKQESGELGESTGSQTVGAIKEINSAAVSGLVSATDDLASDKDKIFRVQQKLTDLGYDSGTPDGVMGKNTRDAISAFQQDQNLAVSGELDDATELALEL